MTIWAWDFENPGYVQGENLFEAEKEYLKIIK